MVNLYSDTQTRPTPQMREAIAHAEVGDEQRRDDPTTVALEERVAALLGHEAAVFLPSGTMCNEIAIRLHIRPGGDEILLGHDTHPLRFEGGAPAALSGAVMTVVEGDVGMFTPEALDAAIRAHPAGDRYAPRPRLVCVEQPTNMGGGRVWPPARVEAVLDVARAHGLRTHLDGARLMNAVVASGVDAAAWASGFDSAWLDFTKGLAHAAASTPLATTAFIRRAPSRCARRPCARATSSTASTRASGHTRPPPMFVGCSTQTSRGRGAYRSPAGCARIAASSASGVNIPASPSTTVMTAPDSAAGAPPSKRSGWVS